MKQRDLDHPANRLGFAEPSFDSEDKAGHRYADKLEVRAAELKAQVRSGCPPPQNAPLIIQEHQHGNSSRRRRSRSILPRSPRGRCYGRRGCRAAVAKIARPPPLGGQPAGLILPPLDFRTFHECESGSATWPWGPLLGA